MGYPSKLLNPGEQLAVDVRPHWKYLARPAFAVLVVVAGGVAALIEQVPRWAELAVAGVLVLALVWLGGRYLRWATTSFAVTDERLVLREGILRRTGREIRLDSLTDISYSQTLLDRVLHCGDILLESPGRDSQEVFPDLPHPVAIQNEIYRLLNQRRGNWSAAAGWQAGGSAPASAASAGGGPAVGGQAAGGAGGDAFAGAGPPANPGPGGAGAQAPGAGEDPSVATQLSQLDDLRKRGVISRREFAAKKAELLSRM